MKILVLGATGVLGRPTVQALLEDGHAVRVMARDSRNAREHFQDDVEIATGDARDARDMRSAALGCEGVHVSLPQGVELPAVLNLAGLPEKDRPGRISYVSGTSVHEDNRWFEMVRVKLLAEKSLARSGVPHTIFCPTWVMETLPRFVRGDRAVIISGKSPPELSLLAAADFGRMVAASFRDDAAIGKRLFCHGPETIPLPRALRTFLSICRPDARAVQLKLWQATLMARIRREMAPVVELIRFFERVGELGDPGQADTLLGPPSTTFSLWLQKREPARLGS